MAIAISPRMLLKRILIGTLAALGLTYCGDYFFLHLRMLHPKPADPFEILKAFRVLAIPEKNGKMEYEVDVHNPEQIVICVHSLFLYSSYSPC